MTRIRWLDLIILPLAVAIMIAAATMGIVVPALHGSLFGLALGSLFGALAGWGLWHMAWTAPAR